MSLYGPDSAFAKDTYSGRHRNALRRTKPKPRSVPDSAIGFYPKPLSLAENINRNVAMLRRTVGKYGR